jgi:hypothetical protein
MTHSSDLTPAYVTFDANVVAAEIRQGKIAYYSNGKIIGDAYTPAMMEFAGTDDFYNKTRTSSGNLVTVMCRFKIASFTGTDNSPIGYTNSSWYRRVQININGSDHAQADQQNKLSVVCVNSANTVICELISNADVADGNLHTVFFSFDAGNGTVVFKVDGVDADNASATNRTAPTTGTLANGATSEFAVGLGRDQDTSKDFLGAIGFVGMADVYLTNWSDFFTANGYPKELDESGWTEWGSQPPIWQEHGDMVNNLGSDGAMTKTGTILLGKGGNR